MHVTRAAIPDVLLIEPDVHRDARGFFLETYHAEKYRAHGMLAAFVQDNHSQSSRGTVRGLHLQVRRPQAKLIRVIAGEIFDVAVDVRRGSPTFGRWVSAVLSSRNFIECYVPPGFAHGFAVISESAQVEYKCSEPYDSTDELGIAWNDPELGIRWPVPSPLLSPKDSNNPQFAEISNALPSYLHTDL